MSEQITLFAHTGQQLQVPAPHGWSGVVVGGASLALARDEAILEMIRTHTGLPPANGPRCILINILSGDMAGQLPLADLADYYEGLFTEQGATCVAREQMAAGPHIAISLSLASGDGEAWRIYVVQIAGMGLTITETGDEADSDGVSAMALIAGLRAAPPG